jgi:hypothetical protein
VNLKKILKKALYTKWQKYKIEANTWLWDTLVVLDGGDTGWQDLMGNALFVGCNLLS